MLYCIVLKLKLLNFSSHLKNIIHIRELESIFGIKSNPYRWRI